jgi:2-polyprenyl-3-methyl-5-hydroxy-6-metoxy-1,4-benzoquinol methylase
MTWDPLWDGLFQNQSWGKYPGEELIRFVARNYYGVPDRSSVRLLEVGCGPGANLWFCAREGFTVHGVDGAHTAVMQARRRLDSECPGWKGSIDEGDLVRLRYPDAHFDAVMDNEAVCHNDFASSCTAYREIARVLKPDGKLFVRTFATGTTGDRTGEPMGRNAWRVSEGPMLGKGLSRFTDEGDFSELFGPELALQSCDLLTWTLANRTQIVREWILVLKKHI